MPEKTLTDWLQSLGSESHMDLSLTRMQTAVQALNLSFSIPIITVGGTNGKGSVVRTLETIYHAAGYQVGSYTSPHLFQFNERIKINTLPVDDATIARAFAILDDIIQQQKLTYFEAVTLAAFWIFKDTKLDVLILEVGLGGRLDAVNVIDPSIAVITNIDLDHTDKLGATREAIASEKAGIFRQKIPIVCGDQDPPQTLIKKAADLQAHLLRINQDFPDENTQALSFPTAGLLLENMQTAVAVVMQLQAQLPVALSIIQQGLNQTHLPGRQQILHKKCKQLLDVAHNPAGLTKLAEKIAQIKGQGKVLLVISMLQDKDILKSFTLLKPYINHWYIAPLQHERAATLSQLQKVIQMLEIKNVDFFADIHAAYQSAEMAANQDDLIVIAGSFFTVAAAKLSAEFLL